MNMCTCMSLKMLQHRFCLTFCICMYTHTCIHTYAHIHTHMHKVFETCVYVYVSVRSTPMYKSMTAFTLETLCTGCLTTHLTHSCIPYLPPPPPPPPIHTPHIPLSFLFKSASLSKETSTLVYRLEKLALCPWKTGFVLQRSETILCKPV